MHDLNQQLDDYLASVIERFDVESLRQMLHFGAVGNDVGSRTLWIGTFEPAP